jgi:hypothetical protein
VRGDPLLRASDARDVDAVEEHRELAALESSAESVLTEVREAEAALLEALVIEDEASVVPGKHLGPVAASADEDEEVAGVEVLLPLVADDGGKPVDGIAHVHPLGSEQDADSAGDEKHVGPSYRSACTRSATYFGSVPTVTRMVTPSSRSTSTAPPPRAFGAGDATTCTGTKAAVELESKTDLVLFCL